MGGEMISQMPSSRLPNCRPEGAHRSHRQPGDQVDGGGVAAAVLQRDEPRGQSDPDPGQQPEHAGGLGADAAQAGRRRVVGRAGPGRDDLGGCAVGFRTAGEWSSHDSVPFLFSSADDDRRAAALAVSQA
jgi:hypothetical protein